MLNYLIFSKTMWSETPRLRHQVSRLLRDNGGKAYFIQKPGYPHSSTISGWLEVENGIKVAQTRQLIHHQLRVFDFLARINERFEIAEIKKAVNCSDVLDPIIINFNYDYYFLRDIFPDSKIITFINDDFVAQARFFSGRHVLSALEKTCRSSDEVLVVSTPLASQVEKWCRPHLFFPWADTPYRGGEGEEDKYKILLWAHVDKRIDFDLIIAAAKARSEFEFCIVGPVSKDVEDKVLDVRRQCRNVVFMKQQKLDDLPCKDFFASIIPYKNGIKDIEAVTMSNKTLQLLSRGMPLVVHGMPFFFEHDSIIKADSAETFIRGLDFMNENHRKLSPGIESLVAKNQSSDRYDFLMKLIS